MNVMEASWVGLVEFANELDPDPQFRGLSDAQVEQEVRDGASRIAAMQCRWLLHLAEFVVRGTWSDGGARTPGQWLSWACGEAGSTAREHVRVALALRYLPVVRGRFAAGTLSYSKVRALTRVAVPEIEAELVRLADSAPASVVTTILARSRWSAEQRQRWDNDTPDEFVRQRDVRRVQIEADMVELRIRLPVEEAVAVEERLDRLVDLADRAEAGDPCQLEVVEPATESTEGSGPVDADRSERPSRGARRALALCDALATAVAAGAPDRSGTDDHLIVLHVDAHDLAEAVATSDAADAPDEHGTPPGSDAAEAAAALAAAPAPTGAGDAAEAAAGPHRGGPRSAGVRAHVATGRGRGMMLPRSVLAWLVCDAELRLAGIADDGHPADIGRRSRTVPADLRRALQLRDRHCRFPGCHATRHLHAHHVAHWARGGPTDLANLLLICAHHHRFVHAQQWTLQAVDALAGRWTFHAPGKDDPHPPVAPMPHASAASLHDLLSGPQPPPTALQPPWWDGAGYDLNETIAIVGDMLLAAA